MCKEVLWGVDFWGGAVVYELLNAARVSEGIVLREWNRDPCIGNVAGARWVTEEGSVVCELTYRFASGG
jgi:hypothetical protein